MHDVNFQNFRSQNPNILKPTAQMKVVKINSRFLRTRSTTLVMLAGKECIIEFIENHCESSQACVLSFLISE